MPYDDQIRSLLNSRSARTTPLVSPYSPARTATDVFSMRSPQPHESPSVNSNWTESPSCYSQSQLSLDDTGSETLAASDDHPQDNPGSMLYGPALQRHQGSTSTLGGPDDPSDAGSLYRSSYVDPLRDSSDDEGTEVCGVSSSMLSDAGAPQMESDTSVSSGLTVNATDPRLSFLGPKTRMISKAPWEEDGMQEDAVSDTETQADTLSIFSGKLKAKGRSRSKTLTSEKGTKERRFLGSGWSRPSTDTRPSVESFKKSMDSSIGSQFGAPVSPRAGSFLEQMRTPARAPSLSNTSPSVPYGSGGARLSSDARTGEGADRIHSMSMLSIDSRETSSSPSPTASKFIHPYANLDLLPPGRDLDGTTLSKTFSNTTLTSSIGTSAHITPFQPTSSATLSSRDETSAGSKKEKRRPPEISVSSSSRLHGGAGTTKSPSALSTSFAPMSPSLQPSSTSDNTPTGMIGFPGSPACNLISLEQAQMIARERSKNATTNIVQTPPRQKQLTTKKSKVSLVGIGGGFSSTIGGGAPSPMWVSEDGRARAASAGSALHGHPKGHSAMSGLAAQSAASVNIVRSGIENIPETVGGRPSVADSLGSSGTISADSTPVRTLKSKRSGILRFIKGSASPSPNGNPNISAPSTPVHLAHNTLGTLPPVPKLPAHFRSHSSISHDEEPVHPKRLPPVVVSSPSRRSPERSQSLTEDSHASVGDHHSGSTLRDKCLRSNTDPLERSYKHSTQDDSFDGLKLRPVSSTFNGLPEDYLLSSPQAGSGARSSNETRASDDYGFPDNVLSPATPSFPMSVRSNHTHVSSASSGSDALSSSADPRTPSSLGGFPPGVPRTSSDSQSSAAIIASLREQLRAVRHTSRIQIKELESQVAELKLELQEARCDRCGRRTNEQREPIKPGIVNRPRARTGGGSRGIFGAGA